MSFSGRRFSPRKSAATCLLAAALSATSASVLSAAESAPVAIELNKLEPQGKSCRAYVVIDNPSDTAFQTLKLDLVFFQTDGTIGRRLAFDLAPLRPVKKTVKTFDLEGVGCETIGSVLVNDVLDCRDAAGPVPACLDRLKFSSRAAATLGK
jgi:hypothetical protein